MISNKLFIHLCVASAFTIGILMAAPTTRVCNGALRVHLTISSLVNESVRQLEIHWSGASPQAGDWVGIFDTNPSGVQPLPPSLAVVNPAGSCDGWQRTEITEEGRPNKTSDLGFTARCLNYYIGYIRNHSALASSCLRLEPTWMTERPGLGRLSLSSIFIPGAHNDGTYGEYDPSVGETQITKYTETQDEDILSQLIRGVRYLDIRVGYYRHLRGTRRRNKTLSGYWLTHGLFKIRPMEEITKQVRQFLNNTPSTELVIFDVHEFTIGFNLPADHDRFVAFLLTEFQGYFIPSEQTYDWTTPISSLWSTNGRLIVSYDNSATTSTHTWLWQGVKHMWGNINNLEDLYTYLAGVQTSHPHNRAWSAMAELTPNTVDVITDRLGGLRVMAESVNRNVTNWYLGSWGETANIVAVDYFRGTDIVQAALEWNDKRILKRASMLSKKN